MNIPLNNNISPSIIVNGDVHKILNMAKFIIKNIMFNKLLQNV